MKEEDIFDILDGIASEETMRQHHILRSESADYQTLFNEYAHTHALLMHTSMEKTAFNFTDKLIDRWEISQEVVVVQRSYKLPIYFVVAMCGMIILLVLIALPMNNNQAVKVDFSGLIAFFQNKLIAHILLLINALMIFYFFDKRVLKPYFQKRYGV